MLSSPVPHRLPPRSSNPARRRGAPRWAALAAWIAGAGFAATNLRAAAPGDVPPTPAASSVTPANSAVSSASLPSPAERAPRSFTIGETDFLIDGTPFVIRCGEIHYPRVPKAYWRHRLKMARALGLNTVCAYLFWNYHEWEAGRFDWTGERDAAEFCRMAQEEGLWVILRPGPYSCAEWEAGGLPWWLFKNPELKIRTADPAFLQPAARWLREVGRVFAPLQVSRGGPILMVQVENEYGFFGKDAAYLGALRQQLVTAGFEVPLFACNPVHALRDGFREDLFNVVNFGRDPQAAFAKLREVQPRGPLMNGEYYPGWFVTWGTPYNAGDADRVVRELGYMLEHRHSFSLYMAHGGTTFGLWAGADRPYKPDASSYDYGAPVSEAGWATPAFHRVRELFARHLQPGETLPPVPEPLPVAAIAPFPLRERAPVFANLPAAAVTSERPHSMEDYGQAQGLLLYRTTLPAGRDDWLEVAAIHDFAWVYLDGAPIGYLDRRRQQTRLKLPARAQAGRLEFLVEAMGRVNFGPENFDRKGLVAPVRVFAGEQSRELSGWEAVPLPLDHAGWTGTLRFAAVDGAAELKSANMNGATPATPAPAAAHGGPAFWRGSFNVATPADTFLDVRSWGRGVLWVNGRCLGRFWNIGPTQTMFCPGAWLRAGANDVLVLDLQGPTAPTLAGLVTPILDQLRPELDPAALRRATGKPDFLAATGTAATSPTPGAVSVAGGDRFSTAAIELPVEFGEHRVALPAGARGRYVAFELLEAHDGGPLAALAEIALLGTDGRRLASDRWKVLGVDSEENAAANCSAENVLDGQSTTFWQTRPGGRAPPYPHWLVLDLGEAQPLGAAILLPRFGSTAGAVRRVRVHISDAPFGLTPP